VFVYQYRDLRRAARFGQRHLSLLMLLINLVLGRVPALLRERRP